MNEQNTNAPVGKSGWNRSLLPAGSRLLLAVVAAAIIPLTPIVPSAAAACNGLTDGLCNNGGNDFSPCCFNQGNRNNQCDCTTEGCDTTSACTQ
jgi:hypothetical protein